MSASGVIAPCPIAQTTALREWRPRYGLTTTRALFLYDPAGGGGCGGICLPPPPPPLTGLNPPPPLASFAGSKSRTSFSQSVSVFETSFSSFIFRLPFCCCEPHLNRPSAYSLDFYCHGATSHKQKIESAIEYIDSNEFVEATPKSLRLRKRIVDAKARKRMSANIILNPALGVSVPN